ncbi:MAG: acyl-CoA dehydrogenase family protein [Hyphomicrobium sp.]
MTLQQPRMFERDEGADLLDWLRDYGAKRINSLLIDTRRCIPPYIILDFGNAGLLGLQAPRAVGGLELSHKRAVAVLAQLAALDLSLGTLVVVHNCLGIGPIMRAGQEPARSEMLSQLATGRVLGAFALTEPAAGSNPNALEGIATVGADDQVRLSAQKMWIGSAGWAGLINVFARYVDKSGAPSGTCGYVVPSTARGLSIGPELLTMGMRGMVQNLVRFDDVEVSDAYRLGDVGQGFLAAQDAMMMTRLALGALSVGAMKRCLQLMTRYADRRTGICAGRLISNPVSRMRLSTSIAEVEALACLVDFTAELLDRKQSAPEELFIVAKVCGSEFLWQTVDRSIQMLGGRGYLESNIICQIMRDARVGRIFEGPTETLLHHLGARLMLNPAPLGQLLQHDLSAGDVFERLSALREHVKNGDTKSTALHSGRQARDWDNYCLGGIAAKAILYAVARKRSGARSEWVIRWAETAFSRAIAETLKASEDIDVRPEGDILGLVDGYRSQIGDIEQSLPAEEWRLDPYLRLGAQGNYDQSW